MGGSAARGWRSGVQSPPPGAGWKACRVVPGRLSDDFIALASACSDADEPVHSWYRGTRSALIPELKPRGVWWVRLGSCRCATDRGP